MKTIAHLKGAEFLTASFYATEAVEELARKTNFMEIWRKKPTFTGNETDEEKLAMHRKQIVSNVKSLMRTLMVTNPEATVKCIMALCVREEGAPEPDGIELLSAAMSIVSDKRVVDFLLQLGKSGLFNTED